MFRIVDIVIPRILE